LGQTIGVREEADRVKIVRIMVNLGKLPSLGFLLAAAAMAQTTSLGPRTPYGHPDFQGIWDNGTLTPLERGIVIGNDGKLIQLPSVKTLNIADTEATAYMSNACAQPMISSAETEVPLTLAAKTMPNLPNSW
jgi:hypothetical protein